MKSFLQLIRWRNLLIVFLTQAMIWFCVLLPLEPDEAPFIKKVIPFLLLAFSTVCITAAGYIINDYFDVRIDLINKPDKVIIGKKINRRMAILLHTLLNIIGIFIAAYLCYRIHHIRPILIQISTTVLLWFYSTHFKRQFVVGNLIVALLTGLTVLVLVFYERDLYPFINFNFFVEIDNKVQPNPFWVLMVYAYFAFMLTWMREIVKDMEDFRGDAEEGCDTMPIRLGLVQSSRIVVVIGSFALLPLVFAAVDLLKSSKFYLGVYIIIALIIPIAALLFFLPKDNTQQHYAKISAWIKWIMIFGILALIVYYF